MRAVLDEALPCKLAGILSEVGCPTEPFPARWKGLKDGALLDELEAGGWSVLVTCDRNMVHQQTLSRRSVAVIVVPGQRLQVLVPMVDAISRSVIEAEPGSAYFVGATPGT